MPLLNDPLLAHGGLSLRSEPTLHCLLFNFSTVRNGSIPVGHAAVTQCHRGGPAILARFQIRL